MNGELLTISAGKGTNNPMLRTIYQARAINTLLGGAFVAPWEIDELPVTLLDAVQALTAGLPAIAAGRAQVDKIFADWRKKNMVH